MTSNVLVWWSVFIIMTMSFVLLNKIQGEFRNSLNYFLLQEFLGFIFLVFITTFLQYILLMMKVGIRPFHFWVLSVFLNLDNYMLLWFLTFQKLPFVPVLFLLFKFVFYFIIFLGVVFCYIQLINIKNYKVILVLSSTESFNWLLLGILMGIWGFLLMVFYYLMRLVVLLNYQILLNRINYYLEFFLVFLNVPLSFSFFLKIFMLNLSVSYFGVMVILIIIIIFLSALSFINWFVSYSSVREKKFQDQINYCQIFLYFLFILVFFFRFSKI